MANIFITGAAGFIGSTTSIRLLKEGHNIIGVDNYNEYYDSKLKRNNYQEVLEVSKSLDVTYKVYEGDIRDKEFIDNIFKNNKIDVVISWAANAGVRPSIEDPLFYVDVNLKGLTTILEAMRNNNVKKHVFISSSSVYGNNKKVPFSENDAVDNPISPYAATKKAGELMSYTYKSLFNIDTHCLRYFTVYGPKQRPDLAINKFTRLLLEDKEIPMFGDGSTSRDYTYVDDIVEGTILSMNYLLNNNDVYDVFNLGGSNPISLKEMINTIGKALSITPKIKQMDMQPGDVDITYSDFSYAKEVLGYNPKVSFEDGIRNFVEWYKNNEK